jgi:hypothetical protein
LWLGEGHLLRWIVTHSADNSYNRLEINLAVVVVSHHQDYVVTVEHL